MIGLPDGLPHSVNARVRPSRSVISWCSEFGILVPPCRRSPAGARDLIGAGRVKRQFGACLRRRFSSSFMPRCYSWVSWAPDGSVTGFSCTFFVFPDPPVRRFVGRGSPSSVVAWRLLVPFRRPRSQGDSIRIRFVFVVLCCPPNVSAHPPALMMPRRGSGGAPCSGLIPSAFVQSRVASSADITVRQVGGIDDRRDTSGSFVGPPSWSRSGGQQRASGFATARRCHRPRTDANSSHSCSCRSSLFVLPAPERLRFSRGGSSSHGRRRQQTLVSPRVR